MAFLEGRLPSFRLAPHPFLLKSCGDTNAVTNIKNRLKVMLGFHTGPLEGTKSLEITHLFHKYLVTAGLGQLNFCQKNLSWPIISLIMKIIILGIPNIIFAFPRVKMFVFGYFLLFILTFTVIFQFLLVQIL